MCQKNECYLIEAGYWLDKSKNVFKRNRIIPNGAINLILRERSNVGVFTTAYKYNIDNQDEAFLYGDLYFDFDSKDNFEKVRADAITTLSYLSVVFKIEPAQTRIYFSGNKGVHIVVPAKIFGIEPDKKLNITYRVIAENIRQFTKNKTLDLVIYDNKRLFRIPNSIHEATGLYKVPITFSELKTLTHEEIKNIAKSFRVMKYDTPYYNQFAHSQYMIYKDKAIQKSKHKNVKHKGTLKYTPPCIKYLLENGAVQGQRNITIAILASFYKNCGISLDATIQKIDEWNENNTIPTKSSELNKTVKSIYLGRFSYGCNTIKNISECDMQHCSLKKKMVKS